MKKWPWLDKVIRILRNKYVFTFIGFLVWITFFDRNDLFARYKYYKELCKLEEEREYYLSEIDKNRKDMYELMSDPANLEKFAREKYLMKKENEDIFIIIRQKVSQTASLVE